MTYLEKMTKAAAERIGGSFTPMGTAALAEAIRSAMSALFGADNVAWLDQQGANDYPIGPGFFGYPADKTAFLGAPAPGLPPEFVKSVERVLNSHSMENGSDTPDWILAEYFAGCLLAWNKAVKAREKWHGRLSDTIEGPAPT